MASVETSSPTSSPAAVYSAAADRKGGAADDGAAFQSVFQNATEKADAKAGKADADAPKRGAAQPDQNADEMALQTEDAQSTGVAGSTVATAALNRIKIATSLAKPNGPSASLQDQLAQLPQDKPEAGTRILSALEMQDKQNTQVKVRQSVAAVLSPTGGKVEHSKDASNKADEEDAGTPSKSVTAKPRTATNSAEGSDTTVEPTDLKTLMMLLDNAAATGTAAQHTAGAMAQQVAAPLAQQTAVAGMGKLQRQSGDTDTASDAAVDLKLSKEILATTGADHDLPDATAPVSAAPDDPAADTIFRLSRADGKGGTLDMVVSDKKVSVDDKQAAAINAKVENVNVLDARRFLGFGSQDNVNAVTQAISQDKDWSGALSSRSLPDDTSMSQATSKVVNTLKIQMHPLDLGQVTATMHLRNDELTVALRVQTGEAYRQLNQDQDRMIDALRAQGYAVDQITVQLVTTDQQDAQPQQQGQQSRGDAGAYQNQGREQQDNNARRQATSGAWQSDDTSSSANGTGTADPARSGDVYI